MRFLYLFLLPWAALAQSQMPDSVLEVEQTRMQFLQQNPVHINRVTAHELQELPFLTEIQIANFIAYRDSNGPFLSMHELQIVAGWNAETLQNTLGYLHCEASPQKWYQAEEPSQQLLVKLERTLEQKIGFSPITSRSKIRYTGNPYAQNIRYRGKWNGQVRGGFILQKDPGEKNMTDFSSYYLEIKPSKWIDKLILGDFTNQWGQGLVQSGGFSLGKTYESIRATQKFDLGSLPYSSGSEANFYRGFSLQSKWNAFRFSTFISSNRLDAHLYSDSTEARYYRSFDTDGNHRTVTELANKQTIREQAWGTQLLWLHKHGNISLFQTEHRWNFPKRNTQTYNQSDWQGDRLINYSIAHQLAWKHVIMAGEFAWASPKSVAIIESVAFPFSQKLDFSGLLRYYETGYFSPRAQALGEGSQTKNELGVFIGNQFQLSKYQRLSSYVDFFYFPKRNFSHAYDGACGIETLSRFQWDRKQKGQYFLQFKWNNQSISTSQRQNQIQTSFDVHRDLTKNLNWHSRLMLNYLYSHKQNELGSMWLHDLKYTRQHWKLQMRIAWIQTPSYDTRLYAYEPTLPYSFSLPAYYDPSMRNILLVAYKPNKQWEVGIKIARTQYFNKETIGSGLDMISAAHKTDLAAQVVYHH